MSNPKKWIQGAVPPSSRGGLHKSLGIAQGKRIPKAKIEAAAKEGGKVGKQARLAETLEGFHHGKSKKEDGDMKKKHHHKAMDKKDESKGMKKHEAKEMKGKKDEAEGMKGKMPMMDKSKMPPIAKIAAMAKAKTKKPAKKKVMGNGGKGMGIEGFRA
jgi:hypothetical protein